MAEGDGPRVGQDAVTLRLADPDGRWDEVALWSIVDLGDTGLRRSGDAWHGQVDVGDLARLEYLFSVREAGSEDSDLILDPANPRRVEGAFGPHSWLPLPGYREPGWLEAPVVHGARTALEVPDTPVGEVRCSVWSPAEVESDQPLPLLLSHDGPEMDHLGGLTRYVGTMVADGRLPAMRVALVEPGDRDVWYAANPAYADALVEHLLPALAAAHPPAGRPVLIGQSLGGLAALHAEWTHPGTFAGIAAQSGSFFVPDLDGHESGFSGWASVTGFVTGVLHDPPPSHPAVSLTCGTAEENLANNRLVADRLRQLGLEVAWGEVADGHCYTTWRDLLDPHLGDLLARVWA